MHNNFFHLVMGGNALAVDTRLSLWTLLVYILSWFFKFNLVWVGCAHGTHSIPSSTND